MWAGLLGRLSLLPGLRGQAAPRRPNVILIVAGVWRAQAVPWAGDSDVDAPNLARLSQQAISFSRAYSCYPHLLRALPCVAKGVFPHMLTGAGSESSSPEFPSIDMLLRGSGYRTAAFTARQAGEIVSYVHAASDQPFFVEWTFDDSASSLEQRRDRKSLHLREDVPSFAEAAARDDLAVFYSRAKARDRDIGMVIEALDRPGNSLVENTIVVFTSLHGEQFGSHGIFGDDAVYEESVRIPLLIRYPRAISRPSASDTLVSQVDLAPTLLQWCGVPIPPGMQGRDLSQLLQGAPQAGPRPDAIYAEGRLGQPGEWRMLVAGYDKFVTDLDGNVTYLFNLADDPYEATNLAKASAQQLKRDELLARQQIWKKKLQDGVDASGLKKR
jgi:arylsulfatase A-like enzyme